MKKEIYFTYGCQCCDGPLTLGEPNDATDMWLRIFDSKELAQLGATDDFPEAEEAVKIVRISIEVV